MIHAKTRQQTCGCWQDGAYLHYLFWHYLRNCFIDHIFGRINYFGYKRSRAGLVRLLFDLSLED